MPSARERLEKMLQDSEFGYEFVPSGQGPTTGDPVLLIETGAVKSAPNISVGLSVNAIESEKWESKCWLAVPPERIRPVGGNAPSPCPDYKLFTYKGVTYHPYSVNLAAYPVFDLNGVKDICKAVSAHIIPAA